MIGTPARPTTILSAKFTSMNRNSRNVIFQAPFGVGCAVMAIPQSSFPRPVDRPEAMLPKAHRAMQPGILTGPRALQLDFHLREAPDAASEVPRNPSRSRRRHDWDGDLRLWSCYVARQPKGLFHYEHIHPSSFASHRPACRAFDVRGMGCGFRDRRGRQDAGL